MAHTFDMTQRTHFFDLDQDQLADQLAQIKMPRFRVGQLLQWVYEKGVTDPQQMSNLSKLDRQRISDTFIFERYRIIKHQSATDGTEKLLLSFDESNDSNPKAEIECVMIPSTSRESGKERQTACISSQVGCPVGCKFCASGINGLDANLTTGLIVEQVFQLNKMMRKHHTSNNQNDQTSPTISNVVFMGMGEPLNNFNSVVQAVRTLAAPWAFDLSGRRITISTVGLPAQIRRLAEQLGVPATLAISLHAPNNELRKELIPWAEHATIESIIDSARYYFSQTSREVTLEYLLLRQVNDQPRHAQELAKIAKQVRANINLIRYNEVKGLPFGRPASGDVIDFQRVLKNAGVNAHIRASRGRDIAAACGQLRHESSQ